MSYSMRPMVAIIDPDPATRQSLHALLTPLDVDVDDYDSAESYFAQTGRVAARKPACVISDVVLPGISGLQLLQRIRAADSELPVVLFASDPEVPMAVEAMRSGATDFIERPRIDVMLLRRLSTLLSSRGTNCA